MVCACILVPIVGLIIAIKIYAKLSSGICKSSKHLVGKVVIVTGGNAGVGYEAAKDFADRGARVIIGCRNEGRGTAARDKIIAATGNSDVHYRNLDLASLKSVRSFANDVIATEKRLDILVNNAGIYEAENVKTEDGLLLAMQTNHFGPFLLTNLLLPLLKTSAPSRIINVSSALHLFGKIEFDNLNMEKETKETFSCYKVYCNNKLCNVLMTVELARRLKGTGVTANSVHPGLVVTEIMNDVKSLLYIVLKPMQRFYSKNAWEGAQTTIYLTVSPDVEDVSGEYFADCKKGWVSKTVKDKELSRKLWEVSEKLVKLKE